MIRLTLLLTAGIVGAMLVFGAEEPRLARAEIEATVLDGESLSAAEPVATVAPVVEAVEVTRASATDPAEPKLITFLSAADAPAEAVVETVAAAEPRTEVASQTAQEIVYTGWTELT